MLFELQLKKLVQDLFPQLFNKEVDEKQLLFQPTRKEFEGDITLVVFNLAKQAGLSPDDTGKKIGDALVVEGTLVSGFNVIKGFLNISIHNNLFLNILRDKINSSTTHQSISDQSTSGGPVLVEYSSPNTNKPLHLGHIRNNLLGYSVCQILETDGNNVVKVNIVNDRGIHICKSMLAWQKYGSGETPESTGLKGDHLVGKYYVEFDKHYREEVKQLEASGWSREEAEKKAPLLAEAQNMLRKWEEGDPEIMKLWETMNKWVYAGFDVTYKRLGVDFDKIYYESQTYLLGKSIVEEGLKKGILYKKNDGSVWIDLRADGLDEKVLLRSDGTSVYMTQDLGTAVMRYEEYQFSKLIYVVGNEQDYHFKVLFLILKKLGYEWADRLYHLSYNMVDLPSGKMKSREGTVVDADELIEDMVNEAAKLTRELGKLDDFESAEAKHLFEMLGLGALKYFILKVDPEKRMLFNPDESIDFNGNTGPFIQYTHARIRSVLRKAESMPSFKTYKDADVSQYSKLEAKEKEMVRILLKLDGVIHEAADRFSPALIANYAYELAKSFNQFYHDHPIIDPEHSETSKFRLNLCSYCAAMIHKSTQLLGIGVPEKM
ncbi:MAG: arginine--tRNA ligase [Bacteroidia bacterium]|nr:arginine--tRNA ligase [Bacteroidota bacterium]MBP9082114.1 arginine--tRNA ligase [Bacteroidia bacterium]